MHSYCLINIENDQNKIPILQNELHIGRELILNCEDKRISRKHATIRITEQDEVILTAIHTNPVFYRSYTDSTSIKVIKKNDETKLVENDKIGFLHDNYWFCLTKKSPHTSQNTEEMPVLATEDVHKNILGTTDDENSNGEKPIVLFRVRNIAEINASTIEDLSTTTSTESTAMKRQLPSWMNSDDYQEPSTSSAIIDSPNKKRRVTEEEDKSTDLNSSTADIPDTSHVEVNIPVITNDDKINDESPNTSTNNVTNDQPSINDDDDDTNDSEDIPNVAASSYKVSVKAEEDSKRDIKVKIEAADSSSTSIRDSCQYGIKCYRQNPVHRRELAHPGDTDYRRPNFPPAPSTAPDCPFANSCYRRNPIHFQNFKHPPSTNPKLNRKKRRAQQKNNSKDKLPAKRKRKQLKNLNVDYGVDDDDLADPFINDSDSDSYHPSDDDDDDEDTKDILANVNYSDDDDDDD